MAPYSHYFDEHKTVGVVLRYWLRRDPATGKPRSLIARVAATLPAEPELFIGNYVAWQLYAEYHRTEPTYRDVAHLLESNQVLRTALQSLVHTLKREGVDATQQRVGRSNLMHYTFSVPADGMFKDWVSFPESQQHPEYSDYIAAKYPEVYPKLQEIIRSGRYPHADTYRIARVGDARDELLYTRQQRRGCCGYYDRTIRVGLARYQVGFNYGH